MLQDSMLINSVMILTLIFTCAGISLKSLYVARGLVRYAGMLCLHCNPLWLC